MTIKTLIADDEPLARDLIARWVNADPRLRLVGEAVDGEDMLDQLRRTDASLLFLDIQMPGLDGLAALDQARRHGFKPHVIFVTAWDRHAIDAFDLDAGDYLVKPVRKARFHEAIARAKLALDQRACFDAAKGADPPIVVRDGERTIMVSPPDIVWVEAKSQYAQLHTRAGGHLLSRPLAEVEAELPDHGYLRVHRSALVNLAHVTGIRREGARYMLDMSDGASVAVARSRQREVIDRVRHARAIPS